MATYRTLRTIARRMGWKSPTTVLRRREYEAFPIFRDFTRHGGVYAISDELITAWELAKANVERDMRIKRPWKRTGHSKKETAIGTARRTPLPGIAPGYTRARVQSQPSPAPAEKPCFCGT